jgi:V-type H+-transporting ATPase subunit a
MSRDDLPDFLPLVRLVTSAPQLTMMGFCAVYAGLMYNDNDCFSLGLNLFGSRWEFDGQEYGSVKDGAVAVPTADYRSDVSVYPFGLDPVWHVT